jgi:hypothetical protein
VVWGGAVDGAGAGAAAGAVAALAFRRRWWRCRAVPVFVADARPAEARPAEALGPEALGPEALGAALAGPLAAAAGAVVPRVCELATAWADPGRIAATAPAATTPAAPTETVTARRWPWLRRRWNTAARISARRSFMKVLCSSARLGGPSAHGLDSTGGIDQAGRQAEV